MKSKPRFKQASWGEAYARSYGKAEGYLAFLEREFPAGWRVIEVQRYDSNMMSPATVVVTAQREESGP